MKQQANQSMQIYLVGGAVRDQLLNREIVERDYLVVGASVDVMLQLGFMQVGKDFPVFLHPKTKQEYALARTERKQGKGYTGFVCYAEPDVSIEEDLLRRDLTVNAMAQHDDGTIIDPYNGQQDLKNKILRHVSPAFAEDPLRVLRVARFAARYHYLGFTVASETMQLMQMNYYLENGLMSIDSSSERLNIHYDRYNEVITQMLGEVLKIQQQGNSQKAGEFIEKYIAWTPELHGRLAERLRDSSHYRFVTVRYEALSDD